MDKKLPKWTYSIFPMRNKVMSTCPWCDRTLIGIYNCKYCPSCSMPVGMNKGLPYKYRASTPIADPYHNYAVVVKPKKYAKRFWDRLLRLIVEE